MLDGQLGATGMGYAYATLMIFTYLSGLEKISLQTLMFSWVSGRCCSLLVAASISCTT